MGLAMAMAMHCTRMLSRLSVPTRVAAILITQICPPLNLCILATLFQEIYLKSEGLSTLFWIKRVEHANFEKLLQYFQNNAKIVQSLLAVKASTNIFPQNLFPTKTGVNTVRGPQLRGPKHLRVQWIKDMGQLLHVEKTSCCKPQPQTTLQKKTALYILSLQAYYDSTTIHFSVISSFECKQFWRNRTSWVCPGQYFYLLSVIHLIFLVIIFILLFFFLLCPLFLIVFPFSSISLVY